MSLGHKVIDDIRTITILFVIYDKAYFFYRNTIVSRSFINPRDNEGSTPLHNAAAEGHFEIFKLIIEKLEIKNPSDNNGSTPLHSAAENGHLNICKLIISSKYSINPKNHTGLTPLHLAAQEGKVEVYKFIYEYCTMLKNPEDQRGFTPLHLAAKYGYFVICKLLIENVKDKSPVDIFGNTPKMMAKKYYLGDKALLQLFE